MLKINLLELVWIFLLLHRSHQLFTEVAILKPRQPDAWWWCFFWLDQGTAYTLFRQTVPQAHAVHTVALQSEGRSVGVHVACSPFVSAALCLSGGLWLPSTAQQHAHWTNWQLLSVPEFKRLLVSMWTWNKAASRPVLDPPLPRDSGKRLQWPPDL